MGNNGLLPCFGNNPPNQLNKKTVEQSSTDEVEKDESPKADELEQNVIAEGSHMVMHKGALVDIEKLLQQLNRSEKAREETELRLCDLLKSNSDLQSSNSKSKDKIKDLQSELKSSNRKVSDAESSLSSANVRRRIYMTFSTVHATNLFYWFSICRKSVRITIQYYVESTIELLQFSSRVNEAHRRRSHRREYID